MLNHWFTTKPISLDWSKHWKPLARILKQEAKGYKAINCSNILNKNMSVTKLPSRYWKWAMDEELILTHYFFVSHFIKNQKVKLTSYFEKWRLLRASTDGVSAIFLTQHKTTTQYFSQGYLSVLLRTMQNTSPFENPLLSWRLSKSLNYHHSSRLSKPNSINLFS